MNDTTWTIYREYLDKTGNEAAAASLTLAHTLQETIDAKVSPMPLTALTVAETADRLKVTRQTIYRLFNSGRLPGCRAGRSFAIPGRRNRTLREGRRRRPSPDPCTRDAARGVSRQFLRDHRTILLVCTLSRLSLAGLLQQAA